MMRMINYHSDMRHYLTRIITYTRIAGLDNTPQELLSDGTKTLSSDDKERFFTVRKVFYDEGMTPLFTIPDQSEPKCRSVQEIKDKCPYYSSRIFDAPILDQENYLKVWEGN